MRHRGGRDARRTACGLLAATTWVLASCGGADGPPAEALGYRAGGGLFDGDEFLEAERWLESPIAYTVQFGGRKSPRDMNGSVFGLLADETSSLPDFANRLELSITVPLAFGTAKPTDRAGRDEIRTNLLTTAGGEHDDAYRRLARRLVEAGYGDAIVRIAHEFNGAWAPWSSRTNEDEFIAAWRHVHTVLRQEAPDLRFEWTAIRPAWIEWGRPAYPGDEYVDVIGLDIYWRVEARAESWDRDVWERQFARVLRDHLDFAVTHGKPVSYPEWGLTGADVPQFIEAMYDWLGSLPAEGPGRLLYHAYFDDRNEFDLDRYPNARSAYRRLFGEA